MILEMENWHLGYDQMVQDCRKDSNEGTVWILCNPDVDAMAAARILCFMLRSDGITYQLRPCRSYRQLDTWLEQQDTEDDDSLRALVLLNLGGSRNLTKLFDDRSKLLEATKVYVMDCRRPFHLANVHAGPNVVLFWDTDPTEGVPSDGDNLSGNDSTSEEEDSDEDSEEESDSEDEGENEFEDDEGEQEFGDDGEEDNFQKKPIVTEDRDYDGEAEDDDEDDIASPTKRRSDRESSSSPSERKRRKTDGDRSQDSDDDDQSLVSESSQKASQPPTLTPRELHRQRRDRLRMYYSGGSFYGSPAAFCAYTMSTQLRFGDAGDLLWLACVGVTDAFLHARLDVTGYSRLSLDLQQYIHRLYPTDMFHRVGNTVYAEHLTGNDSNNNNRALTSVSLSENGRILSEVDFRFFLLRHMSLYESMLHSNYVSTKLRLSTTKGIQRLQELLAKMGCALEECRQPYAFMKPSLKRSLRDKLQEHAPDYGLDKFDFTSFKRVTGYNSQLSACDLSYAVTALLECDTPATTVSPTKDGQVLQTQDREEREALQSFNIAYDALNCSSAPSLMLTEGNGVSSLVNGGSMAGNTGVSSGIRLAMSLQKSIVTTAVGLIDRNAITRLRHFRYAYITCTGQDGPSGADSDRRHHVFAKPLALTKLAQYLMDMHRENGKWTGTKSRPLVLLAEKPSTSTYLVAGYEYPERSGDFVKNRFGQNFELASKTMQGTFRFDSFDTNVVEVASSDAQRFVEQLHYMMDSM